MPSVALVTGLVGGWFLGFGVTNQELDVDWRAITPIFAALITGAIAAGTALYISNKWNSQKGGEVIANEAKEAIKYFKKVADDLGRLNIDVIARQINTDADLHKSNLFVNLTDGMSNILKIVQFLQEATKDEELVDWYDEIGGNYTKFINLCEEALMSDDKNSNSKEVMALIDFTIIYLGLFERNIKYLMDYAMYKRK